MSKLPTLFVSHGSPMLSVTDGPAHRFLKSWGNSHVRPQAILVVSAHWETQGGPAASTVENPRTIHDFGGFPQVLYEMQYTAPGAPAVAQQAVELLQLAGFNVSTSNSRGLDHGAWVPLSLMYPNADIPVFQVSLIQGADAAQHYRLGAALQSLRAQGVLVMGSGSVTHNLHEIAGHAQDDLAPQWVNEFDSWVAEMLEAGRVPELLDYRRLAPHAQRNHPSEEHLLPLFVALGAAGAGAVATRVHASHTYGVLAMDAYTFDQA